MAVVTGLTAKTASNVTISGNLSIGGKAALGDAVSDSIGLYGVSKVSQRRSASQAAVSKLTTTTLASPTAVAAKVNAIITYSMRVRSDLIAIGAIKGAS